MARRKKSSSSNRRPQPALASKLIVIGLLLAIVPLFFAKSPLAAGLRPLAPLGWLLFAVGCALLWWQIKRQRASALVVAPADRAAVPKPFQRASVANAPVDRTATEYDRLIEEAKHKRSATRLAPTAWGPAAFDVIEWRRFEMLVEALFAQAGFDTQSQPHGADEGIDVWLYSRSQPGIPVSVVQCKHWRGKRVGVDKVRELRGVMAAKNVTRGQFVTTSAFTPDAITFANDNGINLLDVRALLALIGKRSVDQQAALLAIALEGEYWRPTCVNCGTKMLERSPRLGGLAFCGCQNYPKCKTTIPMRATVAAVYRAQLRCAAGGPY